LIIISFDKKIIFSFTIMLILEKVIFESFSIPNHESIAINSGEILEEKKLCEK